MESISISGGGNAPLGAFTEMMRVVMADVRKTYIGSGGLSPDQELLKEKTLWDSRMI